MSVIQLKGALTLTVGEGTPVDVKNWVSTFTIRTSRESVTIPATLGLEMSTAAGARSDSLEITFHSGVEAAGLWALLYEAISTPTAEVEFSGTMDEGAVSADNLEWSGTAVLLSLDAGGTVGQLRQQTVTLPIVAGTLMTDDDGS